jgi:hypothetical protein
MAAGAVVAAALTMWMRSGEKGRDRMKMDSIGRSMRRSARQAIRRGSDFLEEALE